MIVTVVTFHVEGEELRTLGVVAQGNLNAINDLVYAEIVRLQEEMDEDDEAMCGVACVEDFEIKD